MELWSCWMPFETATLENGCMQVIPKSHKRGPLKHIKTTDDYIVTEDQYNPKETLAVPMNPGDGLFFHSLLLHSTSENKSEKSRRAITMSYMASEYHYIGNTPKPNYLKICGKYMKINRNRWKYENQWKYSKIYCNSMKIY